MEYTARAVSAFISGEAALAIEEDALRITTLTDAAEMPYARVTALGFENEQILLQSEDGEMCFSRMGHWAEAFYRALCEAYNKAVLRALFVQGSPMLCAKGAYRATESGSAFAGNAPVHLYEDCVALLPPNQCARRIPLRFVCDVHEGDYELTLRLDTGDTYTLARLGYDTAPFTAALAGQMRTLREKTLEAVRALDAALQTAAAMQVAGLALKGAVPIGRLQAIAPSYVAALEKKLAGSRAAESYQVFEKLCDKTQICLGFRENPAAAESTSEDALPFAADNPLAVLGGIGGDKAAAALGALTGSVPQTGETGADTPPPEPYLLWVLAPSPNGRYAALEFAEPDSATFVYRTGGSFAAFAEHLNRALEAIRFQREVIWQSDAQLARPEYADARMAIARTPALGFVRAHFAGRVIHTSADAWQRKLLALWEAP